ncbi:MAG: hypothetical protein A2W91_17500 [Bacteroidetes bacterium GWF2_38_335]|nr:MAG: hypothetical protein A2W91_17500 [Bacteroidetes bacterium GWF2_38_335]HBS88343.1 hypothetical protein [Bacteroidales bacterium]
MSFEKVLLNKLVEWSESLFFTCLQKSNCDYFSLILSVNGFLFLNFFFTPSTFLFLYPTRKILMYFNPCISSNTFAFYQ